MARYRLPFAFSTFAVAFLTLSLRCAGKFGFAASASPDWTLVWSDEFNGPDGSAPDRAKWTYDTGGKGWGNKELEYYTDRPENARIEKGNLVITALREKYTGRDGVRRDYTSARLKTQGLFAQAYGRFEARIKLPAGQGMWPAFWMLGDDMGTVDWPKCGEIDIMENIGKEPGTNHGSLHGPGFIGGAIGSKIELEEGLSSRLHLYAIEWEPNVVRFYLDGQNYNTFTPGSLPAGAKWVFDHPFFIILNVAVGGDWPGPPDSTTVFPQRMFVDYVRVYKQTH
jgi:beta-glucanase (GH16 family)